MSSFLTHTSFTALTQIYNANSFWKRLIWTILVIGMFAWLVVQCYWLLDKYYRYPIEVKLDLKVATVLEFPSVTICNLNPIKEDRLNDETYKDLRKFVNPETHDFLFHEIMQDWLSGVTENEENNHGGQWSTRHSPNVRITASARVLGAASSITNSNSSISNKTTTEPTGIDHETFHKPVTDGYERHSTNGYHQHNGSTHAHSSLDEEKPENAIEYLRSVWQQMKDSMSKEEFINMLHASYMDYQRSKVSTSKQTSVTESNPTEATKRRKRQTWSSSSIQHSNFTLNVTWEFLFQNLTFNKWNMLNSSSPSSFYEQRDDEYEAAMKYAYITAKLDMGFVEMSGHQKEDFIASCDFNGYQCSPQNFSYFHNHKFGNCYTFNSRFVNETLDTMLPGPDRGLRIELFLDQDNYVANLASEAGAKILVHKKGSIPFPEDDGVSVLPGRSTLIGMRQVSYSRLPPPYGQCGNVGETTDYYNVTFGTDYSKLSCVKSCYQDLSVKFCNCSLPFYFVLDANRVCDMTNNIIERCVTNMQKYRRRSFEKCDKKCPQPCQEIRYDLFISAAKWPSEKYQPFLNLQLHQTNWMYRDIQESDKQFTKLQIYFKDLMYQHLEQQKSYESMNLISDLGGQLGLWLGLSAITIGELCSCLFGVGRLLPLKCWGNKPTQSHVKITPLRYIDPATLEEMCKDMCPAAAKYIPPYVSANVPINTNV